MESNIVTRIPGAQKKRTSPARRDVLFFAFFLFLSFVFWYLNSLGKDLETDIKYPVSYINTPKNRILREDLPARLNLLLKGPGYSILKLKISGNKSPVEVDFSRVNPRRYLNGKSGEYYIVTSDLVQTFNSQLKSVCKVVSVKPDTLFLLSGQDLK